MNLILDPWPWYIVGPLITITMVMFLYFGQSFGISSSLKHMCTVAGAGKFSDFFRYDWRDKSFSLVFVVGLVIGGWLSAAYLNGNQAVDISDATRLALEGLGISDFNHYAPDDIFGNKSIGNNIPLLIIGGVLIGFGTRYANGCTSGHAIMGLANLQWPSLLAVVGFFVGGLIATFVLLPIFIN